MDTDKHPAPENDTARQLEQMREALKQLTPEARPLDHHDFMAEVVNDRGREAATKAQSDAITLIRTFGNELKTLQDRNVKPEVYNLPLKLSAFRSSWGLKLHTEGDRQVVILSEGTQDRPSYTRYAPMNLEAYLAAGGSNLSEETSEKIKNYAAADGTILVEADMRTGEPLAFPNETHTFVWRMTRSVFQDASQIIEYNSNDRFKQFTDERELRSALREVADQYAKPLEEFIPIALSHLQNSGTTALRVKA